MIIQKDVDQVSAFELTRVYLGYKYANLMKNFLQRLPMI